jgi:hypothetical protein
MLDLRAVLLVSRSLYDLSISRDTLGRRVQLGRVVKLVNFLAQRRDGTGADGYFHVLEDSDDRLILVGFNSVEGSYDVQKIRVFGFLVDRLLGRGMVFLIAQQDMVQKRTLAWKEGARHLKSLSMPKFRLLFSCLFQRGYQVSRLDDKPHFSRDTEVRHGEERKLL